MKEEYSNFCLFIIGLTLLVGTAITNYSIFSIVFFGIYYFICIFFLALFTKSTHFLKSFGSRSIFKKEQIIILAGDQQKNDPQQNLKVDRFLSTFEPSRAINISIITWALFLGGIYIFYQYNHHWGTLISLASSFFIINSFFIGHLLIALMINLLLVIGYYSHSMPIVLYILYAFLQISSLYLISLSEKKDNQISTFSERKKYLTFLIIALTFVLMAMSFSTVIPKKIDSTLDEAKEREQGRAFIGQLNHIQTQLENLQSEFPESSSQDSNTESNQKLTSQIHSQIKKIKKLKSQMKRSRSSLGENPDLKNKALEAIREGELALKVFEQMNPKRKASASNPSGDGQNENNSSPSYSPSFSKEDKEQLKNLMNLSSEEGLQSTIDRQKEVITNLENQLAAPSLSESELQDMKSTLQNEQDRMESLLSGKGGRPIKLAQDDKNALRELSKKILNPEIKDLMEREALTQSQMKEISKALEQTQKPSEKKAEPSEVSVSSNSTINDSPQEKPTFKNKPEDEDNNNFELIKKILPLLFLIIIIVYVLYRLKKRGIKKVEPDDPKIILELQKKWSNIKKLKLSPREEIIMSYNFFHDCLKEIHYQHESPPSCIIYTDLSEISPELEKSTLPITDIFAQVFYGDKEITKEKLVLFRQGMKKFLKFYQLS
jgi:hypothetical protein